MPTPFPGMDPYLERPDLWPDVHNSLIASLRDAMVPGLRPKYYVSIEERTYLSDAGDLTFGCRPDVSVVHEPQAVYKPASAAADAETVTVELPMPDEIRETYLEVRAVDSDRVITVLELLSPTNKRPGDGRALYEKKRLRLLGTLTHFVEVDLLRAWEPMTMRGDAGSSHYRILVSRAEERPRATLLKFGVQTPIPKFRLPLEKDDEEPLVDMNRLLHELYDRAGYDLRIDYTTEPEPPLGEEESAWAEEVLREAGMRTSGA